MHISEVKTAFKIADVEYVKDSTKLNFNYLKDLKDRNKSITKPKTPNKTPKIALLSSPL
ncbi:hypothetical protein KVC42_02470 [Helicobacter pylori]|nr:hypothetical protein KVC42_02470 [Helicobacter pylori]